MEGPANRPHSGIGEKMRISQSRRGAKVRAAAEQTRGNAERLAISLEPLESRLFMTATTLAAPVSLGAKIAGPTSVQLSWTDKAANASGYNVLRSTDGVNFTTLAQVAGSKSNKYNDLSAVSDTDYTYEVQAYIGSTTSAVSNRAAATTPLLTPTGLAATAVSGADVLLNWTSNDSSATGYSVLRSTDGKHYSVIATLAGNVATTDDLTVTSGHYYAYEVQATNGTVISVASNVATVSTPLAAPSGLSTTVTGPWSISLNWTGQDADAAGYYVLRSTDGTHFSSLAKLTGNAVSTYTDKAAASAHQYTYEVEAFNVGIVSAASSTADGSTPLAPAVGLSAKVLSPMSVQLTWTYKDSAAAGYNILRSTDGVDFTNIAQMPGAKAYKYIDAAAISGTAYTYEVQAYNGNTTSAVSNNAPVTTPLVAPSGLTAAAGSPTDVQLTWTGNDTSATGYSILRTTDGKHYASVGVTSGEANFDDTTVVSGHWYGYEVIATEGAITSAASNMVSAGTPLAAPSNLSAAATGPTSVSLTWMDNDSNATGYIVLRSSDGVNFKSIGTLKGGTVKTCIDTKAISGHVFEYEIQATAGSIVSVASNAGGVTTPLYAPTKLADKIVGTFVNLSWTDNDSTATDYQVSRSDDGVNFMQLTDIASAKANGYSDTTAAAGQTYYYEVQAKNATASSLPTAALQVIEAQGINNGVAINTRYGNELVITAGGAGDSVSITQSGQTLNIVADGQSFSDSVPMDGVFVYARGGADSVSIDSSVTAATTVDSIDNAVTTVTTAGATVSIWADSNDTITGTATIHRVASFAGGVSKAVGASLKDPTDSGATTKVNLSLFGSGPTADDINQGEVGDCYFLSSLAAFAGLRPATLEQSAVDLGDGTFAVEFYKGSTPSFIRVNNDMPKGPFGGFEFEHPGANNTMWAMVMEKAFAYFRTGANTYNSINSGWMGEVYGLFNVSSNMFSPNSYSESSFYDLVSNALASGDPVTFGTPGNAPNLVSGHAYTLVSATVDGSGVTHYVVRNPWGVSGDSIENSHGYATLTFAQMEANFTEGVVATS